MAIDKKDKELIDKHLRGNLSEKESFVFAEKMKNTAFIKELDFYRDLQNAARQVGRKDLKTALQKEEINKSEAIVRRMPASRGIIKSIIAAAAAIILLILCFKMFYSDGRMSEQLFAQNYFLYPNVVTEPIIKGTNTSTPLALAMQKYELKEFVEADNLLSGLPASDTIDFYRAIIALETENYPSAKILFNKILQNPGSEFTDAGNFYLGLLALKEGKEGRSYFEKVANGDNLQLKERAKRILERFE